jgi:hypothetical protein
MNPAGTDVCRGCASAALDDARRGRQAEAVAALTPAPTAPERARWITRESTLLLPEILVAGALLVACPVWFVFLLRHGQTIAAIVLFIGIAPAVLLGIVAVRQRSAGGLYLTSWVTFVAMAFAAVVERLTQ